VIGLRFASSADPQTKMVPLWKFCFRIDWEQPVLTIPGSFSWWHRSHSQWPDSYWTDLTQLNPLPDWTAGRRLLLAGCCWALVSAGRVNPNYTISLRIFANWIHVSIDYFNKIKVNCLLRTRKLTPKNQIVLGLYYFFVQIRLLWSLIYTVWMNLFNKITIFLFKI
jgi:hypothetical protein